MQLIKIVRGGKLPSVIDSPSREAYMGRVAMTLLQRLPTMPRETLAWRLEEWLSQGAQAVTAERLSSLEAKTLICVGSADVALPSVSEAERLSGLIPDCAVHVVDGAGHSSTCGSRIDLAAVMRSRFVRIQQPGLRTSMKETAGAAGVDLGLEERAHPSVNPLAYWSKQYFKPQSSRGVRGRVADN